MISRSFVLSLAVAIGASGVSVARAADAPSHWNHTADKKMTQATAFTVAPILPIPLGTLQDAKLSNGATLVLTGRYYDLHDRSGTIVARFDPEGHRTLEDIDHPIVYAVTATSVLVLGAHRSTLMTLPRPGR